MPIATVEYDFEKIFSVEAISQELQNGGLFLLVWEGFKELVDNAVNFYYHGCRVGLTDSGKPDFFHYESIPMTDFISGEYKLKKNEEQLQCEREIKQIQQDKKCDVFKAQCLLINKWAVESGEEIIFTKFDIESIERLNKSRREIAHQIEIFLKQKRKAVSSRKIFEIMDLIYKVNRWYSSYRYRELRYDLFPSRLKNGQKITQETVFLEHILLTLNILNKP